MSFAAVSLFTEGKYTQKHIIITGHYGTGKTNVAVNLALELAKTQEVCLVDCDIVNPYFRSTDNKELLESHGIKVLSPNFANTNLDTPSLPAAIHSVFSMDRRIIWDVGGDDAGAIVLGMFAERLKEQGYAMLYVVNKYRPLTETAADMEEYLLDIEKNSRLKAVGIINNSNLGYLTDEAAVRECDECLIELAQRTRQPILFTCIREDLNITPLGLGMPIKIYTKQI